MELPWYIQQLNHITKGQEPTPKESVLLAFMKSVIRSGWGDI